MFVTAFWQKSEKYPALIILYNVWNLPQNNLVKGWERGGENKWCYRWNKIGYELATAEDE